MLGFLVGLIVGDRCNGDPITGAVTGIAMDALFIGTVTFVGFREERLDKEAQTRISARGEKTNDVISSKIGEDFTLLTMDASKDKNAQKQLKLFGESKKYVDGMKCSTMTNYTISVSDEQYSNFVQSLKNLVDNGKFDSNTYSGDVNVLGDYSISAKNYENSIVNVYDIIDDCVKNSKYYTVTSCGPTSNMINVLKREYNFTTPDTLGNVSSSRIPVRTNFIDNGLALVNVSNVEKNNDNNYVYVNTLQPESAGKTWSLCTGRFKVIGENLTQDQVFDKIYSGNYTFIPGDKQYHKSTEYVEDNDVIFNL